MVHLIVIVVLLIVACVVSSSLIYVNLLPEHLHFVHVVE